MTKDITTLGDLEKALSQLDVKNLEAFVHDILMISGRFNEISMNANLRGYQIDVLASEKKPKAGLTPRQWMIEIKRAKLLGVDYIQTILHKWNTLKEALPDMQCLIVSTGQPSSIALSLATANNIEIWGLRELAAFADRKVVKTHFEQSVIGKREEERRLPDKSDAFVKAMGDLQPGNADAIKFQRLSADILEYLFCPPLEPPKYEYEDAERRNRRDMIFDNSASEGFWKSLKEVYHAHYIVVDAKNYAEPLSKRPIIDIAHYLKHYGCGLFGMLISRSGVEKAGEHAIKEQWIGNNKMIVVMSDDDIKEMLEIKKNDGRPEEIIRKKIAEFRMLM